MAAVGTTYRMSRGPTILFDRPPAEPSPPRLLRFPVGPVVVWVPSAEPVRWVQGELSNFGPWISAPDKDGCGTEGEESGRREMRAARSVHCTTAGEPDQTGCHEGPTLHFDRPLGFPVGPAVLWASAEPVRWVQGELLKFRPLDFGPR
jgi:hypothetical protein